MTYIESILLAFVQGLTEFLPISSSGHLVVVEHMLNLDVSELLFFDVLLHVATLIAVILFFREKILRLIKSIIPGSTETDAPEMRRWIVALAISTVITGIIGLSIKDVVEGMREELMLVGIAFLCTGALLISTWFFKREETPGADIVINLWLFAVIMGFAQGLAVLPGVSRSGATVCAALLLGTRAKTALEYSFLMSIPAVMGAALLELREVETTVGFGVATAGFITALISGLIFLWLLSLIVRKGGLHYFAFYVIPLGIAVLLGVIGPSASN